MKPFDKTGEFCSSVKESEVQRLAVNAAGFTVLSGGVGLAVQTIGTLILARLLTPGDFGVVTMVTTFSLLLVNFGANGFTEAIIQREKINHIQASNLFWLNLGIGILLTAGFAGAGSLLARLYHDPVVAQVAVGISASILITSTAVEHQALLKRGMRFSATSGNEVVSRTVALFIAVSLALSGWGHQALVAGVVAQTLAQSVGAWILCRWIPALPRRAEGTGSMVRFAMSVYGRFAVNYFARNTDNLLVGWRFGAVSLGYYKKAYDLFALSAGQLTAPLTNVAVSALRRFKPGSIQYRNSLLSAFSVIAFVSMGLSGMFTLAGRDIIRLLLGQKWVPAGLIFTFFAPGIGAMVLYYMHSWIHLSIGRPDRWFRWSLVEILVTLSLFLLGLPWGPEGVAVAWAASFWILTIPALWYAGKPIEFGVAPMIAAIWRYVLASLLAGCATGAVIREIPTLRMLSSSPVGGILTTAALFGTLYLGAVVALNGGWEPIYKIAALVRDMFSPVWGPTVAVIGDPGKAMAQKPVPHGTTSAPLVSILIPAFNAEEWIADTLRSALSQTWQRKEIIVVDDGSSDRTLAIARQFQSECIQVVTQNNQGAAAARNKAFSLSRGSYIQWLDADDLLAPDKIARQMERIEQCQSKRTLVSSAWGRFMYRPHRAKFTPTGLWADLSGAEFLRRKMESNEFMQTATWLVSRELSEASGPWNTQLLGDDDGEYFCRVLRECDGIRFVPEARVYYRTPFFTSLGYVGISGKKVNAHWHSMKLHIDYLLGFEESDRTRVAILRYLQNSLHYFYPERPDIIKQMEHTARAMGGQLVPPRLSWKYAWIQALFGWSLAKRFQRMMPIVRWKLQRSLDKALLHLETGGRPLRIDSLEAELDPSSTTTRKPT